MDFAAKSRRSQWNNHQNKIDMGESKMARTCAKPKFTHLCVFCDNWTGDAGMTFRSAGMGYEYEREAVGKCIKKGTSTKAASGCTSHYEPNHEAKKLL